MRIIANRSTSNGTNDRFGDNLQNDCKGRNVDIAVAFFTDHNTIQEMLNNGSHIRLIVRLNIGTEPLALSKIFDDSRINIKYLLQPNSIQNSMSSIIYVLMWDLQI